MCVVSDAICVTISLVSLLKMVVSSSCYSLAIFLLILMILFSGFILMLDNDSNQAEILKVITDSMKHL